MLVGESVLVAESEEDVMKTGSKGSGNSKFKEREASEDYCECSEKDETIQVCSLLSQEDYL